MYLKLFEKISFGVITLYRQLSNLAIEHVYGIHPVLCALTFCNREMYKLYVQCNLINNSTLSELKAPYISAILKNATNLGLPIVPTETDKLNKMVNFRAHQGVVLQASPTFIFSLNKNLASSYLNFKDLSINNLARIELKMLNRPIILLLDHLTDILNFGCILRSAAFFGVYAIILSTPCATPSPLVSKLSVGAMECMNFYRLTCPEVDLKLLSDVGFLIVGTSGDNSIVTNKMTSMLQSEEVGASKVKNTDIYPRPLILALGNEARGLSANIVNTCDFLIRIPGFGDNQTFNKFVPNPIPSSLNVSVAAGIILYQLTVLRHGANAVEKPCLRVEL